MHDSAELIQHLQALLLPHTGVVEARKSCLGRRTDMFDAAVETSHSNS